LKDKGDIIEHVRSNSFLTQFDAFGKVKKFVKVVVLAESKYSHFLSENKVETRDSCIVNMRGMKENMGVHVDKRLVSKARTL
jgi:hypothetical protein